ncbi:BRISC and BRCA1-A complex member 1-like [Euwallacea fornicatus]|uniref:BRISC and BRCA1-A complex member 1-like n=1 Tax=Euwallacea fornicatus TaxID=995702 RepID=UPI00338EE67F
MAKTNERIIPIQIEGRDEPVEGAPEKIETDKVQNELSKSLEELQVTTKEITTNENSYSQEEISKVKVKVKPAPPPVDDEHEYLKEFDVFEKRDGNIGNNSYPTSDVKEHIVLVIDRAQDENFTSFIVGNQRYTPLSMVIRSISILIKLKLGINPHHEFAIMVMNSNRANLIQEFTNDLKKLNDCLSQIKECEAEDIFDLNTVFDIIQEFDMPSPLADGLPPPFVLRTILFYGRSYTLPQITRTESLEAFLKHPFTVCDILMTHEPVEISNHCQAIFDDLQTLDQKGIAYFFPVCRNIRRMQKCMGKLLGHPFQRPFQKLIKQ